VADVEHGERLINTDDPSILEPLRHRPGHSTGARRHIENLFVALQNEHLSQFLGEISANPRDSAIKLCSVLRIVEVSFVPVAMPVFVSVSMVMVVAVFVTMAVLVVMSVGVLMPMFVSVIMSVVMFVTVIVFVFMFVFFAHGFAIPSLKFD
jgi:hypothetical protein